MKKAEQDRKGKGGKERGKKGEKIRFNGWRKGSIRFAREDERKDGNKMERDEGRREERKGKEGNSSNLALRLYRLRAGQWHQRGYVL